MTLLGALRARVDIVRKIAEIFDPRERILLLGLLGMMVLGAAFEVLGIGAVTAFITVLALPSVAASNPVVRWIADHVGRLPLGSPILWFSTGLVLLFLLKNSYLAFLAHRQLRFAYHKESRLSRTLLARYLDQPYAFFLQRNSAQLMRNVTHEVSHVITGIVLPGLTLIAECIVLTFVLAMLASVEPIAALAAGILLGGTGLVFVQSVKPALRHHGRERAASAEARIRWVNQAIGSVKEVKLLGCANFFIDAFDESSRRYARAGRTASVLNSLPRPIMETVAVAALMLVVILSIEQGRELKFMLPTLTLFALAAMRIMPSLNRIAPAVNQIRFWLPSLDTVHADLHAIGTVQVPEKPTRSESTQAKILARELRTEALGFRYAGSSQCALQDLTIRIPKGSSVGFMGASGAGKSTLIDLLLGLIDPSEGRILIDDRTLPSVREAWQGHIGYVPQFIYLLDDSVRRNVALGVSDAEIDDARVWMVLRHAHLEEVVRWLPQGLDSFIGDRGMRLSGGERQRLGIARALYRDPEVLVFDEATSALDGQTEREVAVTIRTLAGDRTVLIVAHRTTTVRDCDTIFFLNGGRLVDQGPFSELVARNEAFRTSVDQNL